MLRSAELSVMYTIKNLLFFSLFFEIIGNNAYASGLDSETAIRILLIVFSPIFVALIAMIVGLIKKRNKINYKGWIYLSMVFFMLQILFIIYLFYFI